jgi:hypothetical protein
VTTSSDNPSEAAWDAWWAIWRELQQTNLNVSRMLLRMEDLRDAMDAATQEDGGLDDFPYPTGDEDE